MRNKWKEKKEEMKQSAEEQLVAENFIAETDGELFCTSKGYTDTDLLMLKKTSKDFNQEIINQVSSKLIRMLIDRGYLEMKKFFLPQQNITSYQFSLLCVKPKNKHHDLYDIDVMYNDAKIQAEDREKFNEIFGKKEN